MKKMPRGKISKGLQFSIRPNESSLSAASYIFPPINLIEFERECLWEDIRCSLIPW